MIDLQCICSFTVNAAGLEAPRKTEQLKWSKFRRPGGSLKNWHCTQWSNPFASQVGEEFHFFVGFILKCFSASVLEASFLRRRQGCRAPHRGQGLASLRRHILEVGVWNCYITKFIHFNVQLFTCIFRWSVYRNHPSAAAQSYAQEDIETLGLGKCEHLLIFAHASLELNDWWLVLLYNWWWLKSRLASCPSLPIWQRRGVARVGQAQ